MFSLMNLRRGLLASCFAFGLGFGNVSAYGDEDVEDNGHGAEESEEMKGDRQDGDAPGDAVSDAAKDIKDLEGAEEKKDAAQELGDIAKENAPGQENKPENPGQPDGED